MLLDTSVWIEYLKGTARGEVVSNLILDKIDIYTCPISIAELSVWCYKNHEEPSVYLEEVKHLSRILELSEEVLSESGRIYYEERKTNGKIGLVDCIIYATARSHGLDLLTKDHDFESLPGVRLL